MRNSSSSVLAYGSSCAYGSSKSSSDNSPSARSNPSGFSGKISPFGNLNGGARFTSSSGFSGWEGPFCPLSSAAASSLSSSTSAIFSAFFAPASLDRRYLWMPQNDKVRLYNSIHSREHFNFTLSYFYWPFWPFPRTPSVSRGRLTRYSVRINVIFTRIIKWR